MDLTELNRLLESYIQRNPLRRCWRESHSELSYAC